MVEMQAIHSQILAVIGAGNIGRILIKRLLASGVSSQHMLVVDADEARAQSAALEFGVKPAALGEAEVSNADVILICVPPKTVLETLQYLAPRWHPGQLVISCAAAIPLERLEKLLPRGVAVIRVMPNTPSLVGRGMNPVAFGSQVSEPGRALALELLKCLGETIEVRDEQEKLMHA